MHCICVCTIAKNYQCKSEQKKTTSANFSLCLCMKKVHSRESAFNIRNKIASKMFVWIWSYLYVTTWKSGSINLQSYLVWYKNSWDFAVLFCKVFPSRQKFGCSPGSAKRAGTNAVGEIALHTERDCSFRPPLRRYSYADVRLIDANMKHDNTLEVLWRIDPYTPVRSRV